MSYTADTLALLTNQMEADCKAKGVDGTAHFTVSHQMGTTWYGLDLSITANDFSVTFSCGRTDPVQAMAKVMVEALAYMSTMAKTEKTGNTRLLSYLTHLNEQVRSGKMKPPG